MPSDWADDENFIKSSCSPRINPEFVPREEIRGETLWNWRRAAIASAGDYGIEAAEVDWFLRELLGWDQLALRLHCSPTAAPFSSPVAWQTVDQLWQQRLTDRMPVQYLLGQTPWRDFTLQVSPAVLIPRPETEQIVDLAIDLFQNTACSSATPSRWADLGTGSGAIAIGLAKMLPDVQIHAVDICPDALALAAANAQRLNTPISFHQGSWWLPLRPWQGQFQAMVANPPYIPSRMIPDLQVEVQRHEPHLALDGGEDGLDAIQHLIQDSPLFLCPGGLWLVEIMAGQAAAVIQRLEQDGRYDCMQSHMDWAGIDRFVSATIIR